MSDDEKKKLVALVIRLDAIRAECIQIADTLSEIEWEHGGSGLIPGKVDEAISALRDAEGMARGKWLAA